MAKVENVNKVTAVLQKRLDAALKDQKASVQVGYTAAYAVYVHENLEAYHAPGKTAKFLEGPARRFAGEMGKIVRTALQSGKTLLEALMESGLFLQRQSQLVVPVDTGALKNSAFTRVIQE